MKLTLKEAKWLSSLKWDYLRKHPESCGLGEVVAKKLGIDKLENQCGLCELYYTNSEGSYYIGTCPDCPIWDNSRKRHECSNEWYAWASAVTDKTRKKYAELLYQRIKKIPIGKESNAPP